MKRALGEQIAPLQRPSAAGGVVALEGAVDLENYLLGPGDRLEFHVWGDIEITQQITVGPDGYIAVPTIGEIDVSKRSVAQADSLLKAAAVRSYPRSRVSLRLLAVRMMKVSISGAVAHPGSYELSAVDRLSALIMAAGGFLEVEVKPDEEAGATRKKPQSARKSIAEEAELYEDVVPKPSLRRLRIERDRASIEVDYQKFQRIGNLDYNPKLFDGDNVHVPVMDEGVGVLDVVGDVKIPGEYEYVGGDRLQDLLDLAGGLRMNALRSEISIIRFTDDNLSGREIVVNLDDPSQGPSGPELAPDDRIFIRKIPDYRHKYHVMVMGEVNYPGIYPIEEDSTTLSEIIAICGGFAERANLQNAKVTRVGQAAREDPEFDRLKQMSVAEMTDMEYEYFKTRSRSEAPPVVVDFDALFNSDDQSQDVTLQNKDIIEVPTLSPTVNVTGQVNNPGLLRYVPGKNYEYYIEKAGGFGWNARKGKMRLIKAQRGQWVKPKKDTPVGIGDTIFVPEKKEINYWEFYKDILLVISQVATVIIVVQTLR